MKILYDLQLSVLDSLDDGKFLMHPDSNVNVATFLIKGLLKKNPEMEVYLLAPSKKKHLVDPGVSVLTDNIESDRLHILEYDYFGNPFMDRMSFDSRELKQAIGDIHIDLVYTNDPCKVLPYKTFFYYKQKEFIPVISRNHWVTGSTDRKVPREIDFVMRQVEGAIYGDWMTFNSKFAIELFRENMGEFFNQYIWAAVEKKLQAFETVDIEKVDKHMPDERFAKFSILWGHRLSYYTGWEKTFDALNKLWQKRKDFQVFIPDPGNKFTQAQLKEKYPFMTEIDKSAWSHKKYLELAWKVDVCLGNHTYPATWGGLSITEPMAAYTVPIMPKRHAYLEMFFTDEQIYPIFFEDEDDMLSIIEYYIDKPNALNYQKTSARKFCEQELSMSKFIDIINNKIIELTKK